MRSASTMTNLLKFSLSVRRLWLAVVVLCFAVDSLGQQQLPCEFRDSVNISGGTVDAQSNIHHDGIKYEPKHYALISYDYAGFDTRVEVPVAYTRGCICQLRSCVRLCCPVGQWLASDGNTSACVDSDGPFKVWVNVSSTSGEVQNVNLLEEPKFGVVHQKPCAGMFPEVLDEWSIDDVSWGTFGDVRTEELEQFYEFFFLKRVVYIMIENITPCDTVVALQASKDIYLGLMFLGKLKVINMI